MEKVWWDSFQREDLCSWRKHHHTECHYTRQRLLRVYCDKPLQYQIIVSSPSCLLALKFVIKPPSNVTVMAYEAVILCCSASSDLKPTILWMYDGTFSLPLGASVDSLNALIISSANISHSGIYTCNTTDALSSSQTSVTVHVKYPENIKILTIIETNHM